MDIDYVYNYNNYSLLKFIDLHHKDPIQIELKGDLKKRIIELHELSDKAKEFNITF